MDRYKIVRIIGEGSYGKVMECIDKKTGITVAVKKFKKSGMENKFVRITAMREKRCLEILKTHEDEQGTGTEYLVEYIEGFYEEGLLHLVFEFIGDSLLDVLGETRRGFSLETLRRYMFHMILALNKIHELGIIHRDIKLENLLIDKEQNLLKLCDFGSVAIIKQYTDRMLTEYVATRWYRSPEILVGATYGKSADIWAAGCVMAEMTDSYPLFPGTSNIDMFHQIQKVLGPLPDDHLALFEINKRYESYVFPVIAQTTSLSKKYSNKLDTMAIDFLERCLEVDPAKRITTTEALEHPFLSDLYDQYKSKHDSTANKPNGDETIFNSEDQHFGSKKTDSMYDYSGNVMPKPLKVESPTNTKDAVQPFSSSLTKPDSDLTLSQEYADLLHMSPSSPQDTKLPGVFTESTSNAFPDKPTTLKPSPQLISVDSWNVLPSENNILAENKQLKAENVKLQNDVSDLKEQLQTMAARLKELEAAANKTSEGSSSICTIS